MRLEVAEQVKSRQYHCRKQKRGNHGTRAHAKRTGRLLVIPMPLSGCDAVRHHVAGNQPLARDVALAKAHTHRGRATLASGTV